MAAHHLLPKITAIAILACSSLQADILSAALFSFPVQTESFEYDNLSTLRHLPNYADLRQRFSGQALDEVKAALAKLDITESDVHEVVLGTSPTAFYGLLAGMFSEAAAVKTAQRKGIVPRKVGDTAVYCPKGRACFTFLEDALAVFGGYDQIKIILETRQGLVSRLSSNRSLVYLLNKTDRQAPVRAVVLGGRLNTVLSDALRDQSGLNLDWSTFASNIRAFGYSVTLDRIAHLTATLDCKSAAAAGLLNQTLGAMGSLQSVAAHAGKDPASMPFQNLRVISSGNFVELKMDAPIPTS